MKHAAAEPVEKFDPEKLNQSIAAAIAAGTHSHTCLRYCDGCGEPAGEIWYVTIDRKNLCGDCADRLGQGPRTLALKRQRFAQHVQAQRELYREIRS